MLILGLALALAAQATAAPEGNQQIHGSVKLPNLEGPGTPEDKGQRLKIGSFTWGSEGVGGSPPAPGSVVIKTEWPWTACKVGATYPSLSLYGGAQGYLVEDLTVTKCGSESAAFDYKKVTVGAWDAAKKSIVAAEAKPQ
jgi:hypothetical protein